MFTECHWSDGFSKKDRSMRFVMGKKRDLKILRRCGRAAGQIAEVGAGAASANRAGSQEVEVSSYSGLMRLHIKCVPERHQNALGCYCVSIGSGLAWCWCRCSSRRRDWEVSRSRRRRRSLAVRAACSQIAPTLSFVSLPACTCTIAPASKFYQLLAV